MDFKGILEKARSEAIFSCADRQIQSMIVCFKRRRDLDTTLDQASGGIRFREDARRDFLEIAVSMEVLLGCTKS
jgi:hypothetical protein